MDLSLDEYIHKETRKRTSSALDEPLDNAIVTRSKKQGYASSLDEPLDNAIVTRSKKQGYASSCTYGNDGWQRFSNGEVDAWSSSSSQWQWEEGTSNGEVETASCTTPSTKSVKVNLKPRSRDKNLEKEEDGNWHNGKYSSAKPSSLSWEEEECQNWGRKEDSAAEAPNSSHQVKAPSHGTLDMNQRAFLDFDLDEYWAYGPRTAQGSSDSCARAINKLDVELDSLVEQRATVSLRAAAAVAQEVASEPQQAAKVAADTAKTLDTAEAEEEELVAATKKATDNVPTKGMSDEKHRQCAKTKPEIRATDGMKIPKYWSSTVRNLSDNSLQVYDITPDSGIACAVQALINDTFEASYAATRHRNPGSHCLIVRRVQRVESMRLWRQYTSTRAEVQEVDITVPEVMACNGGLNSEIATDSLSSGAKLYAGLRLDRKRNEHLLWHGTKLADIIVNEGFDERVSNKKGGLFGSGVYFADKSSKAEEYSGPGKEQLVMFLSRVTLGLPHCAKEPLKSIRRPPCIHECTTGCAHRRYDSVVSDGQMCSRPIRNREFVIYDRRQAYPEFRVEFSREAA